MREQILYQSELVEIGRFVINPQDADFTATGWISAPIMVFPKQSIWIQHDGDQPFVADTTVVNLYNRDQTYRRFAIHPAGDHCHWFRLADGCLSEMFGSPDRPFGQANRLCSSKVFLAHLHILQQLEAADQPDPLVVDAAVLGLYAELFNELAPAVSTRRQQQARQQRLIQDVKESVQQDLGVNHSLQALAKQHATSPHHLCRVFKHFNGVGLNQYRTQQRLRSVLLKLRDPALPLTSLAMDHGFASHAHMSAQFKKYFGMSPSACRQQLYPH